MSSVSRMAAQLGGGGPPSPGEPGTDAESRADGDSDSVPASPSEPIPKVLPSWGLGAVVPGVSHLLGFPQRITTPGAAPGLKEGKEDLFLT